MRFSFIVPTLLGAGALALVPAGLKHGAVHQLHPKRDYDIEYPDGRLVHVEEVVVTPTPVVVNGKWAPPNFDGNFANFYQRRPGGDGGVQPTTSSAISADPVVTTVPEDEDLDGQPAETGTQQTGSGGGQTAAPPQGSSTPEGSNAPWDSSASSGGHNILEVTNAWRHQWYSNQSDYSWGDTVAKNAYLTATNPITTENINGVPTLVNEGGGKEMHHNLYDGSHAQCEAEGTDTDGKSVNSSYTASPYEVALLMWMCETPTDGIMDGCRAINSPNTPNSWAPPDPSKNISAEEAIGHATILKSGSQQIGVFFVGHIWTADFA